MACLFQHALRHINDSWNDKDFNLVMGTYIGVTIVITFILLVVDSLVYFG